MVVNPSDLKLFQALKRKEASALVQLYDEYGDPMYALARRILNNSQDAEDLIQEIFLNLWRDCSYNPERGSFKTFLMVHVHSRAIDRLRSQKVSDKTQEKFGQEVERNSVTVPLEGAVNNEISERVQQAIAELPEKQRQALIMAYYQGLTQAEIAAKLKTPLGTVKSWFRLSFVKLRQSLQDLMN